MEMNADVNQVTGSIVGLMLLMQPNIYSDTFSVWLLFVAFSILAYPFQTLCHCQIVS